MSLSVLKVGLHAGTSANLESLVSLHEKLCMFLVGPAGCAVAMQLNTVSPKLSSRGSRRNLA